MSESAVKF